ncbi:hypothetical protein [Xenorhabdus poinarii]|nr:hypothetical protein [Xenorhabdus poinarii]
MASDNLSAFTLVKVLIFISQARESWLVTDVVAKVPCCDAFLYQEAAGILIFKINYLSI